MTLEEINYIAQTVGGDAVIASLIFVGFEVDQNSAITRAISRQLRAAAALRIET